MSEGGGDRQMLSDLVTTIDHVQVRLETVFALGMG